MLLLKKPKNYLKIGLLMLNLKLEIVISKRVGEIPVLFFIFKKGNVCSCLIVYSINYSKDNGGDFFERAAFRN